jgi:hypothetical protein
VRPGERFDVVVRQVTNADGEAPPPGEARRAAATVGGRRNWRRVIDAFQLAIPVRVHAALLDREERDYSTLLWIGKSIPSTSRWRKVFDRYLDVVAGRVSTFGGDPSEVAPSPSGGGGPKPKPKAEERFERRCHVRGFYLSTAWSDQ